MTISLRRFQLRERTAAAHAVVDSAIGDFDTLDSYRRYLNSLYRFRAPLEAALARDWSPILGSWRPAMLTGAMRQDMGDLGIEWSPVQLDAHIDERQLLGTLYVLQGSSLGARLLYQRAQAIGLSDAFGARHLAQQSAAIEDWRTFLDILEADDNFDIELATTASLSTFAAAASAFGARPL